MPNAIELRELEDDELENRLMEYRREMLNLRFQLATGQLDNYARMNDAKRNVARVLTILRDREIALAEGREAGPVILDLPARPPRRPVEAPVDEIDDDVDDDIDDLDDAESEDVHGSDAGVGDDEEDE